MICHEAGGIPLNVVRDFDLMDGGEPTTPLRFNCEQCGGEMYPEYYKGIHGQEYKLSDFLIALSITMILTDYLAITIGMQQVKMETQMGVASKWQLYLQSTGRQPH